MSALSEMLLPTVCALAFKAWLVSVSPRLTELPERDWPQLCESTRFTGPANGPSLAGDDAAELAGAWLPPVKGVESERVANSLDMLPVLQSGAEGADPTNLRAPSAEP